MSLYSDLDLSPDASPADIKRAYRRKASEHHPDKGGIPINFTGSPKPMESSPIPPSVIAMTRPAMPTQPTSGTSTSPRTSHP